MIKKGAFGYCSNLTNIAISENVISIEENVFFNCSRLKAINVAPENPNYTSFNGVLYDKQKTILIQAPGGLNGEYSIPSSVTNISTYAFYNCDSLTGILISPNVTKIEEYAFENCDNLTNIVIPPGVSSIEAYTFQGCSNLITVEIPDGITKIRPEAFSNCNNLTNIEIPSSVTKIEEKAFYNCPNLDIVIDNSEYSIMVETDAFKGCKSVSWKK